MDLLLFFKILVNKFIYFEVRVFQTSLIKKLLSG